MILLNHSNRRHIAEIILTDHFLLIKNEQGETEAYHLVRVVPPEELVRERHRHILKKMKEVG